MSPLRHWLGLAPRNPNADSVEPGLAESLDALKPPHVRYLAAYAAVLMHVAYTDQTVTREESDVMSKILSQVDDLSPRDAELIVGMASANARRLGDSEWLDAARILGQVATRAQRLGLLRGVFAVAVADRQVSREQLDEIGKVARVLGLSLGDVESLRIQLGGTPV